MIVSKIKRAAPSLKNLPTNYILLHTVQANHTPSKGYSLGWIIGLWPSKQCNVMQINTVEFSTVLTLFIFMSKIRWNITYEYIYQNL